jgi:Ca-activated chloride channel family protein
MGGDIEFQLPGFLWLLPVLVILALLWQKSASRAGDPDIQAISFISPTSDLQVRHPLLAKLSSRSYTRLRYSPVNTIVIWLVLSCLVLALAEPVKTGRRIPAPVEQRDITLIVDASVSMLLRDYELDGERIDRMTFLKSFLDRFVQQLEGDRISVIVFGESAYTLLPMNDDPALTRRMLSRIKTTMAGRFNAPGEAIALAVKQSANMPERRRILVLFTDADQSTDSISPVAAAELAHESGLPLYTIAIGAATYDAAEKEPGGLIYHPANIDLLQKLALLTGAKSYQAGNEKALDEAIADIDQREKYKKEMPARYFHTALYPIPLVVGLLILSLYQFVRLGCSVTK